jgi:gluconokinase
MGVAGCGKSTIGSKLAAALHWQFADGDSFQTPENIKKMATGHPLTDSDRMPWLTSIAARIDEWVKEDKNGVIACSALKESYRQILRDKHPKDVRFVYLKGSYELFHERLTVRPVHFLKANMLQSQFDTLEEPRDAMTVAATLSPEEIVEQVRLSLGMQA